MNTKKSFINLVIMLFVVLVALYLVKALDISYPITIVSTTKTSELAVVGEGKIDVIPDTAYIDAGITISNVLTVDEAQSLINKTNNAIIEEMKKLGIQKADIKTSNYSIYPNYSYEGNLNRITGYNGNVTITIKVINPQIASAVVEQATKAGANQIQGTRFVVESPEKYRSQARDNAIKNAKEQAQKISRDLGIKLGRVVNVVESSPDQTNPLLRSYSAEGLGGGGAPNIEQGTQTISSVVTLYFEKK